MNGVCVQWRGQLCAIVTWIPLACEGVYTYSPLIHEILWRAYGISWQTNPQKWWNCNSEVVASSECKIPLTSRCAALSPAAGLKHEIRQIDTGNPTIYGISFCWGFMHRVKWQMSFSAQQGKHHHSLLNKDIMEPHLKWKKYPHFQCTTILYLTRKKRPNFWLDFVLSHV